MCGIVCAFDLKSPSEQLRPKILKMAKKIRHRGPDWNGIYCDDNVILAHERLAIVDPKSGKQPLFSKDQRYILAANGEIYNHKELRLLTQDYEYQTNSDCEVIISLFDKYREGFVDKMNGIFGFVVYDQKENEFFNNKLFSYLNFTANYFLYIQDNIININSSSNRNFYISLCCYLCKS